MISFHFRNLFFLFLLNLVFSLPLMWTLALAKELEAADLARRLGCFACHGEGPGYRARSLEGVGARLPREQLQIILTQPRRLYPGAKMPSYAYLPEGERQELLDFLTNRK